jgi:RHS repeat-associated protein
MLNPEEQQFKYNGKEFDTMHGLNWYNIGNRMLDGQLMRYHVPDRFSEKFPWQSPYVQAANNPMKYILPSSCPCILRSLFSLKSVVK